MRKIDILFLTWNRLELNKRSLPNLLDSDPDVDFRVHVYDNNSTDGTVEYLKSLDHPKIGSITFNDKNLGISPVTNTFWGKTDAEIIGKIDNDIMVPKGWVSKVLLRLENAQEENIGPVTLYHWIKEWADDILLDKCPIVTLKNGSKLIRSTHTGGNYLMHRYLLDKLGKVPEQFGMKGGFSRWQYQASGRELICGYIYPLDFFEQPAFEESWVEYCKGELSPGSKAAMEKERKEAKHLLEIPFYLYNKK